MTLDEMHRTAAVLKKAVEAAYGDRLKRNDLELSVHLSERYNEFEIRICRQHHGAVCVNEQAMESDPAATLERALSDFGYLLSGMGKTYVDGLR